MAGSVFRIDHDQAFNRPPSSATSAETLEWIDFTWRFDSGLVVSGVPDVTAALALTAAQQVAIGLACNGLAATYGNPITACSGSGNLEASDAAADRRRERRSQSGPGEAPQPLQPGSRHRQPVPHRKAADVSRCGLTVDNLTNKVALYNFLSTFSGTHFVPPRTYQMSVGYAF